MLKNTCIAILLLFLYLPTLAQDCCAPNFTRALKDTSKTFKNPKETHEYFQQLIPKIKHSSHCSVDALAATYRRYAITLKKQNAVQEAVRQFDTAIIVKHYPTASQDIVLANAYHERAECYEYMVQNKKAINDFKKALELQLQIKDTRDLEYRYMRLGRIYRKIGDYKKAIDNLSKSLELHISLLGEKHRYNVEAFNQINIAYTENNKFEKAVEASQHAISIAKYNEDTRQLVKAYNNLGNTYEDKKEYQKAKEIYERILDVCIKDSKAPIRDCIKAQNNLGFLYMKLKQYQKAKDILHETLQAKKDYQDNVAFHYSYSATLENLADIAFAQDQHQTALDYYQKALIIFGILISLIIQHRKKTNLFIQKSTSFASWI